MNATRKSQRKLVLSLVLLIGAAVAMSMAMASIPEMLAPISVIVSALEPEGRHADARVADRFGLDGLMLQLQSARTSADVIALTPAKTRPQWRAAVIWDFIFIAGYVLLFSGLMFTEHIPATLWEHPLYCAAVTAAADIAENVALLQLLQDLDDGRNLDMTRTLRALPVLSALKWMLFFLAVRAVSIQLEKFIWWRGMAILLRASSTGGSWASMFLLLALPSRPLVTLMLIISALMLVVAAVARIRGVPPGNRVAGPIEIDPPLLRETEAAA